MALALVEGVEFAVRDARCFIRRRSDHRDVAAIEPIEARLLAVAMRTDADPRSAVGEHYGHAGIAALDHLLFRLRPLLRKAEEDSGERTSSLDFGTTELLRRHAVGGMRALPGPRILHWSVTHVCPRRCVYCFAEPVHGSRAHDSTLPRSRLIELMEEARTLGASGILLSGSEPLLRDDLPEIIGDARRIGLEVLLTTKHPVTPDIAARLAQAGQTSLALSVDTLDPTLSRSMIGSASYPAQVRTTVANLKNEGIGFSIQAVLTPATARTLAGLLAFARDEGALAMQLVPFERVRKPIVAMDQDALRLAHGAVEQLFDEARRAYPDLSLSLFEKEGDDACSGIHCDIGATKLFFTPAGRVHRCYKLTSDEALFGADLNEVGIAEAWHGPSLGGMLTPPREAYAGTSCSSCGGFDGCHRSGRCIFEAQTRFGRYAAPDRQCGRHESSLREQA
jgi:MoaA/NifB/PqqE/SkfB family radical SAM enzyme